MPKGVIRNCEEYDKTGSIETCVEDGFTVTAVGDLIVSRVMTKGRMHGFDEVVKLLHNIGADVTFGNFEGSIFDIKHFRGSPQAEYGGAYHVSVPAVASDLRKMGFDLMSHANNHTMDWGAEGMRETQRYLEEAGIVYSGSGETLTEASAARFLETPRGRVGLVSLSTTFPPLFRAADPVREAPGRPGVCAVRVNHYVTVPPEMLDTLRQIRNALSFRPVEDGDSDTVVLAANFASTVCKAGERIESCYYQNEKDVKNILWNVRRGKQFSDFLIVSVHSHQPGNAYTVPAEYQREFAHALIDAGADAYVGHGPHRLRGIEIYKGRPIFYSLGNFIMDDLRTPVGMDMFEEQGRDPLTSTDAEVTVAEMKGGYISEPGFTERDFYESLVAVSRFERNRLAEIRLYPLELNQELRFADRGVPRLAPKDRALTILTLLQEYSEPLGTRIEIEDGAGVIRL